MSMYGLLPEAALLDCTGTQRRRRVRLDSEGTNDSPMSLQHSSAVLKAHRRKGSSVSVDAEVAKPGSSFLDLNIHDLCFDFSRFSFFLSLSNSSHLVVLPIPRNSGLTF